MKVYELKEILEKYEDNSQIQINISDGYQSLCVQKVEIDEENTKNEAVILNINIDDNGYYFEEN